MSVKETGVCEFDDRDAVEERLDEWWNEQSDTLHLCAQCCQSLARQLGQRTLARMKGTNMVRQQRSVEDLISEHGTAEAVFLWAEETVTDLKSTFDLSDAEFDRLKSLAQQGGRLG